MSRATTRRTSSSGAPSPAMTCPPRWGGHRRCYAGKCSFPALIPGTGWSAGLRALCAPALDRLEGGLDVGQHGAQIALGALELPPEAPGRAEHAVGDPAEDDDRQHDDDDPDDEEEHGPTLTGVAGRLLRTHAVAVEGGAGVG